MTKNFNHVAIAAESGSFPWTVKNGFHKPLNMPISYKGMISTWQTTDVRRTRRTRFQAHPDHRLKWPVNISINEFYIYNIVIFYYKGRQMGARWVGNSKFSTCLLEIHAYFDIFWELRCFVLCDTQVVTLIVSWEKDLQKKKIQRETVPLEFEIKQSKKKQTNYSNRHFIGFKMWQFIRR